MAKDRILTNIVLPGDNDEDNEDFEIEVEDDEDLELPQGGPQLDEYEDDEEHDEDDEDEEGEENEEEVKEDPRLQTLLSQNTQLAEKLKEQREKFKKLRDESTKYKKTSLETQKRNLDSSIQSLKENLIALKKQGDPDLADKEIELSTQLQNALLQKTVLDYQDVDTSDEEDTEDTEITEVKDTEVKETPEVTKKWINKNSWYKENPEDAAIANAVADTMIRGGWNPLTEKFYDELDSRLSKRNIGGTMKQEKRSKPAIAGPSRSTRNKSKRVVKLTREQKYAADTLGLDYKVYAKRLRDMETKRDGKYTNIF